MSANTYADLGRDIGVLVQEKQAAYGDSFDTEYRAEVAP